MTSSAEQWAVARSVPGRAQLLLLGLLVLLAGCAKADGAWLADLTDADPFVRALAAIALSEQAPDRARAAVPVLLETVDRAELGIQRQARTALVKVGPHVSDVLRRSLAEDELMTSDRREAIQAALEGAVRQDPSVRRDERRAAAR